MCDFQSGTWECRGDGYLWDADDDGYDPEDFSEPCPKCNTKAFLLDRKESAETTSYGSNNFSSYTGESLWLRAVQYAESYNALATAAALAEIRLVETLRPAKNKEGYEVVSYVYDGLKHVSKEGHPALADANAALVANTA